MVNEQIIPEQSVEFPANFGRAVLSTTKFRCTGNPLITRTKTVVYAYMLRNMYSSVGFNIAGVFKLVQSAGCVGLKDPCFVTLCSGRQCSHAGLHQARNTIRPRRLTAAGRVCQTSAPTRNPTQSTAKVTLGESTPSST